MGLAAGGVGESQTLNGATWELLQANWYVLFEIFFFFGTIQWNTRIDAKKEDHMILEFALNILVVVQRQQP